MGIPNKSCIKKRYANCKNCPFNEDRQQAAGKGQTKLRRESDDVATLHIAEQRCHLIRASQQRHVNQRPAMVDRVDSVAL